MSITRAEPVLHLVRYLTLLLACSNVTACGDTDSHASDHENAAETDKKAADAGGSQENKDAAPSTASATTTANAEKAQPTDNPKLPCAVAKALVANCQKCHGVNPAFGAPMPLVKFSDLKAESKNDSSITVAELAHKRLNDKAKPMPPGGMISEGDKKALNDWFEAGLPKAEADEGPCYTGAPTHDDNYFKNGLTPKEGETCYEFRSHGGQTVDDKSPYPVKPGEHYEQFYFKVPWGPDTVMTRFGGKFDNLPVLHHWLLFTSARPASAEGTHQTSSGSTIGDSSELIGGWAVGGDHVEFPDDMGLELPASGMLNAQWHYYNQGTEPAPDTSAIQICTVPRNKRKNVASLTFLGTENLGGLFGMPAHQVSKYSGTCMNRTAEPITIWGFTPHMHQLGRRMTVTVKRKDGATEMPFEKEFDFNSQITYASDPPIVLQPGDSITSTCTFDNHTNAAVPFGSSSNQEMCYNFTMAYPAHALDNGVFSLIGAKNTCW